MWQEILNKMDRDSNGFLTFEEFVYYMVLNVRKPEKFMRRRNSKNNNNNSDENNPHGDYHSDDSDVETVPNQPDIQLSFESAAQAVLEAEQREHDQKLALKVAELRNKLHQHEHNISN